MIQKTVLTTATLAAIATAAMWTVSSYRGKSVQLYREVTESVSYMVSCRDGTIRLSYWWLSESPLSRLDLERESFGFGLLSRKGGTPLSTGVHTFRLRFPAWAATTLLSVYPAFALIDCLRRRRRRRREGLCRKCEYNLTGNTSGICPECGEPVPPDLALRIAGSPPSAVEVNPNLAPWRRLAVVIPLVLLLIAFGVMGLVFFVPQKKTAQLPAGLRSRATAVQTPAAAAAAAEARKVCADCGFSKAYAVDALIRIAGGRYPGPDRELVLNAIDVLSSTAGANPGIPAHCGKCADAILDAAKATGRLPDAETSKVFRPADIPPD